MSEEISKQYEKGLVNLMSIVEPLIDKFKADKNSIDIQQLQLVAEYLLTERKIDENYIDELEVELDKEKEKNKELFEEYNKRVATIIKYEQGINEIIDKIYEEYTDISEVVEDLEKLLKRE